MAKIFVKQRFGKLVPVDAYSEYTLRNAPIEHIYSIELKGTRNLKHHQKFRVLLQMIFENQEKYPDIDIMHSAIKYELGYCDTFKRPNGEIVMVPKSTAFAAMGEEDFTEYSNKVIDLVCQQIIPGMSESALRQELEELTGINITNNAGAIE